MFDNRLCDSDYKVRHVFFCRYAIKQKALKLHLLIFSFVVSIAVKAQKIDSIFVNLYTDSLKKGTYNYINIDGQLPDGRFIPLDSTHLLFTASAGKFSGNSLCLDRDINEKKIIIKAVLKQNPAIFKEFEIFIKQLPDGPLQTLDEFKKQLKKKL